VPAISETATATPTVLDNFMGVFLLCPRAARRLGAMASIDVEAAECSASSGDLRIE
jgi:hypothetical protein